MMLTLQVKMTLNDSTADLHDDSRQLKELEALLATAPVDGLNNIRLRELADELEDRLTNSLVTRRMARGMKKLYQLLADSAHVRYLTRLLLLLEVAGRANSTSKESRAIGTCWPSCCRCCRFGQGHRLVKLLSRSMPNRELAYCRTRTRG